MRPRLLLTSAALSVVLGATGFSNAQTANDTPRDPTLRQQQPTQQAPNQTTGSDTSRTNAQSPALTGAPPANSNQTQTTPAQTQNAPADARSSQNPQTNPPAAAQTSQPATGQTNQPSAAQTTSPNPTQPSTASGNQPATTAQQPAASPGTANQATAPSSGQAPVQLSASLQTEQRTRLNQAVASVNVRPIENVNFAVSVGTAVPQTVVLQPLPATIVSVIPQYRGYNFFVVRDQIVIVEPSSHRIVDVIERRGGPARAQATTTERKLNLSSQQRDIIRKHSAQRTTTTTTTTGSAPRSRSVTIGEEVPETTVIQSFPEEVYRDVPEIRSYRYIQRDHGVSIVDPQSRRVIEDIE